MRSVSACGTPTRSGRSRTAAGSSFPGISEMASMKVAVLPGDGIGPEIIAQACGVLRKLNLNLQLQEAPVGGAAYAACGEPLPEKTLALAKEADAVLFGAVGDPRYDTLERSKRPEQAILGLRKALALFAN